MMPFLRLVAQTLGRTGRGEATLRTERRPRLLYVMHIDWDWIKQRPQYVAEWLDDGEFDVFVLYVPAGRRSRLRPNPSRVRRLPLPLIPLRRCWLSRAANRIIGPMAVGLVEAVFRPEYLLLTSPELVDSIPPWSKTPVHYDCMDLAEGFAVDGRHRRWVRRLEAKLVKRCLSASATSEALRSHLLSLGASPPAVVVVRNGVTPTEQLPSRGQRNRPGIEIGYVGTISEWFDFELLERACAANPNVRWHLWGPATVPIPIRSRIVYHGVVARHELPEALGFLDGFVMPFRLGPLVRAVDPVKIYEYLSWGKPVIAVYYPELEQFRPFVNFYRSPREFVERIEWLEAGGSVPSHGAVEKFLSSATWAARAVEMTRAIKRTRD